MERLVFLCFCSLFRISLSTLAILRSLYDSYWLCGKNESQKWEGEQKQWPNEKKSSEMNIYFNLSLFSSHFREEDKGYTWNNNNEKRLSEWTGLGGRGNGCICARQINFRLVRWSQYFHRIYFQRRAVHCLLSHCNVHVARAESYIWNIFWYSWKCALNLIDAFERNRRWTEAGTTLIEFIIFISFASEIG